MEDLNLDELTQLDSQAEEKLKAKNRYQQLANDNRDLAQQREAESKARADAEAKAQEAEKKVEFYKNFSKISSKYPEAANFQDQILERVNKGLDVEEATLGLLAKEGKLNPPTAQPMDMPNPIGGSALNSLEAGPRDARDMNTGEMLDSLRDLEKSGELQRALRSGINAG